MVIIRCLIYTLFVCVFSAGIASAQDFSNKGKEFWVVFPPHAPSNNNLAELSFFI